MVEDNLKLERIPKLVNRMGRSTTIESFFKRKATQDPEVGESSSCISASKKQSISDKEHHSEMSIVKKEEVDISALEKDPGKRPPIWQYPVDQLDEIRISYLKSGPYQPSLTKYPASCETRPRRFQYSWFAKFPCWLEYSLEKDAAFCLPCYLFSNNSVSRNNGNAFTEKGFRAWRKVTGKNCAFLSHMGSSPKSPHNVNVQHCDDLMARSQHIEKAFRQSEQIIADNRLRLKTSIMVVRFLTFQGCALVGINESISLFSRGNYIELIQLLASYSEDLSNALQNAPENAEYLSASIQKEILYIFARRVRAAIREEIADSKFCFIIGGTMDDFDRAQLAVVLRFVDKDGYVQERFFDLVRISDISSMAFKKEIDVVLSGYNLNIHNLRGQSYDGTSDARGGAWNGLHALFLNDFPYAYHFHCLSHPLQLALVTAAKEVFPGYEFFRGLALFVKVVTDFPEIFDQIRTAHADKIPNQEIETGSELNGRDTLQLTADAGWGCHLNSIRSLLCMFEATCEVLENAIEGSNCYVRADAYAAFDAITSFDFIFHLHLMKDLLGISHDLCLALENKNQDILKAMALVSTTKRLIQRMRESGWENLLKEVILFCQKHEVYVPDMNARYIPRRRPGQPKVEDVSMKHHYHVDYFIATIDTQLQEMNSRFNENTVDLLTLSAALDPRDNFKLLNIDHICELATRFYPEDFTEQEKLHLRIQAEHYVLDVPQHSKLKLLSTISELCRGLVETGKSEIYHLIYRLLRLVLTLPVSTPTDERSFSAINFVKDKLKSMMEDRCMIDHDFFGLRQWCPPTDSQKMEDDCMPDYLVTHIEKDIAEKFVIDSVIDELIDMNKHHA